MVTPNQVFNVAPTPSLIVNYTVSASDTSYWVKAIDGNELKGRITIASATTTIIKENSNETFVEMFPNPTSAVLKITANEKTPVYISSISGQTIIETKIEAGTSDVDVSQLARGIYFVRVGEGRPVRIIKE